MTKRQPRPVVLLLEDDPRSAEALALLVRDWGFDCIHGSSFEAVRAEATRRAPEIFALISDFHLEKGETGADAARRASEFGVRAPVLLLTGSLRGAARRAATAEGHAFMEKPAAPTRLKAWLQSQVDFPR